MSRLTHYTALALVVFGVPALAMGERAVEVDANADGMLSVSEVQTVYPEITAEQFSAMDLNADGALDDSEVQAAEAAGLMPTAPADGAASTDG